MEKEERGRGGILSAELENCFSMVLRKFLICSPVSNTSEAPCQGSNPNSLPCLSFPLILLVSLWEAFVMCLQTHAPALDK